MSNWILTLPLLLLVIATICDFRTREIPDWISVVLLLIALLAAAFGFANIRWWMVVSGGLLGLSIGGILFRYAEFGGGDAKLIAGVGSILGPVGLLFALFWMAIAGGLLAVIAMLRGKQDYAYAPAITAGFACYLIYLVGMLQSVWSKS